MANDSNIDLQSVQLQSWDVAFIDPPGLRSNMVLALHASPDGSLWVGTFGGGLSRFMPGTGQWQTYTTRDGLASDSVRALHASPDGSLWVGTFGGGLSRFMPGTGQWQTYTTRDGLASDSVQALHTSPDGSLWVGTFGGGLSRFMPGTGQWQTYTTRDGLASDHVRALHASPDGSLWIGTSGEGLSRFMPGTGQWQTYTTHDGLASDSVQALHASPDGALWIGTSGEGLSRFMPGTGQWQTYTTRDGLAFDSVHALHTSLDGALWVGTFGGGLSRFMPGTGQWQTYTTRDGLASDYVQALHASPDGALWIGTSGEGLSRFMPGTGQWQTYTTRDGLAFDYVHALHTSPDGSLWIGTSGGLSRFMPGTGQWQTYTTRDGLASDHVRALHTSPDGSLWIGTSGGLSRFMPGTGQWQTYTTRDGLASDHVHALHTSPDGSLWIGTSGGLSRFIPGTGQWQTYTTRDGLASDHVRALHTSPDGSLWVGTSRGGLSWLESQRGKWKNLKKRSLFRRIASKLFTRAIFSALKSLASDSVQALHTSPDGSLWVGTSGGRLSRFMPGTGQWQTYTTRDGLASDHVQALHAGPDGSLWVGTIGGLSRFMPGTGQWQTYTTHDGLASDYVQALHASPDGSLWVSTSRGLNNIVIGSLQRCRQGAVSSIASAHYTSSLVVSPSVYAHTRSAGFVIGTLHSPILAPIACRNPVLALAYASEDGVWSGECLGGLHLYRLNGLELSLTESEGLPANHVSALATLPGQPHRLWVGTAGGAALVALAEHALHIERTVTCEDGIPSGRIDALVALADGAVFLAYNASASKWIFDPELAQRRASSQVRFIPPQGAPGAPIYCYRSSELLHTVSIRALAMRDETLWAATSGGLFKADHPRQPGTQFQLVTDPGSPQTPLRQLKTNPITRELWMIADAQEDVPARLIGYDPSSNTSLSLGPENGIPSGLPIHDLDFTADGDLVVLIGARRFKGFIRVGASPLVAELRADPAKLRHLPLAHIPEALEQLRLERALEAVRRQLGLSDGRLGLLHTLAKEANLPALASLLGMDAPEVQAVEMQELRAGLRLFPARLSYPLQLQRQILPLLCADAEVISTEDETACRSTIQYALDTLQHRFELPFVLVCQNTTLAHRLIPDGFSALVIDDAILRELLFASQPQQTFAGFLLTRGLLALSPYRTEGAVTGNSDMFYGRDRVVRELMQAQLPQCLLVGPRRVGKTSLLHRLETQLPARRPELQLFMLDLLGVKEAGRFASRLSRTLGLPASTPMLDSDENAVQLVERLREKFAAPARPGLILVDEADSIIEADATAGFPLLAALRSLQAEGVCSFILTGYWYLFRWTLDHGSPVYNFAPVRRLGPLSAEEGYQLASEPMERLGLSYESVDIPTRIVERAGGYPSLIQFLCHQLIEQLKEDHSLVFTMEHLQRAEGSQIVRDHLGGFFRFNTGPGAQLLVYRLLEADTFSLAQAHACLEQMAGREIPLRVIEQILLQLVLYGLVAESEDNYMWTIPLVRDTLLAGRDREYRVSQLLLELPQDVAAWITPPDTAGRSREGSQV